MLRFSRLIAGIGIAALTLTVIRFQPADAADQAATIPCTVPQGFTITRVAGAPLTLRPMFATFDDQGRLYVIDSGAANDRGREANPTDVIRCLEDTDNDGVFDKSTLFADKIIFGTGIVWHDGALFVTSPPSLWKIEDTDHDGTADKRTELVTGFAYNFSCSNDIHGANIGPDGRIYFLCSHLAHKIHAPDGPIIREGLGPWLVRCLPDGSEIEIVSGAVGNPVEVTFLPNGDSFVQGTFWAKSSVGGGLRDAVIQTVEGGEYSVADRDYTDRIRTGDFLPALVPMQLTAPSGLTSYRAGSFGPEYQNNLFATYFNTRKVLRYMLTSTGATYLAASEVFVAGQHGDIHFTDVLEDADGSLLVIDTGAWFRACCPASKIAKPDVLGSIYRVARNNAERMNDPRGKGIAWKDLPPSNLAPFLGDKRLAVQQRAIFELARSEAAVPALKTILGSKNSADVSRVNAVWALCQMHSDPARAALRGALGDPHSTVRQAAVSSVALHRDPLALEKLTQLVLKDPTPSIRREAANALGRIGESQAVATLLEAWDPAAVNSDVSTASGLPDRFLEHSLIYALIRINDPETTRSGLNSDSAVVRRATLIALDQMQDGNLRADEVTALLKADVPALQRVAIGILTHHTGWSEQVVNLLNGWLAEQEPDELARTTTVETIRAFRDVPQVREMIERQLANSSQLSPAVRELLLTAVARTGLKEVPESWVASISALLQADDAGTQLAVLNAVERLQLATLAEKVHHLAGDQSANPGLRLAALRAIIAIPNSNSQVTPEEFDFLMTRLDPAIPVQERMTALAVIASMPADESRLLSLAPLVRGAGPIDLPNLLRAFSKGSSDPAGMALVDSLLASAADLTPETLSETLEKYSPGVKEHASPLTKRVQDAAGQQAQRLAELEQAVQKHAGNGIRGRELFLGKANCHLCHQAEGRGGKVGPDLTGIGEVRSRRDLLEAITFPSATFARGYEPVTVALTDGTVQSGLMGRESVDEMILIEVQNNKPVEVPIRRDEIEQIQLGRVSIMPKGLESQLNEAELSDLLTYLQSLRDGPSGPNKKLL